MPPAAGRLAVARRGGRGAQSTVLEYVIIVAVALGLALAIQFLLVKPFKIPSESMIPTLTKGQRVLADRVTPRFSGPRRGDILVFNPPKGADSSRCGVEHRSDQPCPRGTTRLSDQNFIKRVVAGPGDRLSVLNGRVYLNGHRQPEPFLKADSACGTCDLSEEITIPPGHFFMMGDNRGASDDSRVWGPVPKDAIIGNAFFTYWPPTRLGSL